MEQQLQRRLLDGGFKLRHLQIIAAIAENGTIGGAAQDLYVTQPVVTRALREAEDILGVELFIRGPRGVTPTRYGTLFLEHAGIILTSIERLADNIDHLQKDDILPIRVGTNMTGSYALLPRTLISLKEVYPGLKVSVIEGTDEDLVELLTHRQVDVLIGRMMNQHPKDLKQLHLYDEPIGIMGRIGHPIFDIADPTVADFASFPWVLPPSSAAGSRLSSVFGEAGAWAPSNVIECTSILTIRAILQATDSLAPLPMLVGTSDAHLRMVPMDLDTVPRTLGLTYLAEPEPNQSTKVFIEHLLGVAAEIDLELANRQED
ncbi:MAG: LysR family transcriptional regulator [Gordonia sp. (in: high G+C Gram-positive bacteria)]|uniref:LysR family transcriptional regulator n=1 Tax=Gordonia TaxID=2053 RepID=UPI0032677340